MDWQCISIHFLNIKCVYNADHVCCNIYWTGAKQSRTFWVSANIIINDKDIVISSVFYDYQTRNSWFSFKFDDENLCVIIMLYILLFFKCYVSVYQSTSRLFVLFCQCSTFLHSHWRGILKDTNIICPEANFSIYTGSLD